MDDADSVNLGAGASRLKTELQYRLCLRLFHTSCDPVSHSPQGQVIGTHGKDRLTKQAASRALLFCHCHCFAPSI